MWDKVLEKDGGQLPGAADSAYLYVLARMRELEGVGENEECD